MDLETLDVRARYIRVTNRGTIPFSDRHDGVPVTLEPGKADNLPLDMAAHFFGYFDGATTDQMFRHVCKRQGWNTPAHIKVGDSGKTLAQELFDNIEIKPVTFKLVEEKVDTSEPIPADPQPPKLKDDELPALPRKAKAS